MLVPPASRFSVTLLVATESVLALMNVSVRTGGVGRTVVPHSVTSEQ